MTTSQTPSAPVPQHNSPHGAASQTGTPQTTAPQTAEPQTAEPQPRPEPAPRAHFETVPWKRIGLFMLISYGLFALFAAPFWFLAGGVSHPLYTWVIGVGMWTPAIASLIMAKGVEKTSWRTRVGLRFRGRWKQLLVWTPLALLLLIALHTITAVLMVLRGIPGDLTGATWLQISQEAISEAAGMEVGAPVVVLSLLIGAIFGLLVTSVFALGEEIGWRGWLWPALRPLGRIRGSVVGGVIWSLWHLPIVLIGHNYPGEPRIFAILMFLLPCIAMTLLFGALTDRAHGNPIPAGLAHGAMNSLFGTVLALVATRETPAAMNLFIDTPLGIIGVLVTLAIAVAIMPWKHRGTEVGGKDQPTPQVAAGAPEEPNGSAATGQMSTAR